VRTAHVWIVSAALVIATAIASAASVLGGRYTIISISGNNVAWKLDRITGQAYGCEESEFGPFCMPAPDRIKHTP
jgi:sarcosine oxidase gamma subunit